MPPTRSWRRRSTTYRASLQEDRRALLDRYEIVDYAMKVVGVGSVGLGAMVLLLDGGSGDDPLFLQGKEAQASVYERFLGPSNQPTHGDRVVAGQRRLQATTDVLLGATVGEGGRHWYVRQLDDQKGSAVVEAMTVDDLGAWGELCGWALARGHARSGEPATIAAYLGADDAFDRAMAAFAEAYADQNERDFATFSAAIASGGSPPRAGLGQARPGPASPPRSASGVGLAPTRSRARTPRPPRRRSGRGGPRRWSRAARSARSMSRTADWSSAKARWMPAAFSSRSRSASIAPAVVSMSVIGSAATRTQRGGGVEAFTSSRIRSRNWFALAKNSGADQRTMSRPGTCSRVRVALDVVVAGDARGLARAPPSRAPRPA